MTSFTRLIGATALAGFAAFPAFAQYQNYPYSQTYPQYPQQTYPQESYPQETYPQQTYPQTYPGYGYQQPYGSTGNPVVDVIDQLLGNRYNVTDRQAVRQCANAAMAQAVSQYGRGGYGGYNGYNGYNHGYGGFHVTSITDVQRRSNGLRVAGLMSRGGAYGGYGNQGYGYGNQRYGYGGQLSFRCNVDYQGAVTGIRVHPAGGY